MTPTPDNSRESARPHRMDFDRFNQVSTASLSRSEVDIVVDGKKGQAWILHERPLRAQNEGIAAVRYDPEIHLFTVIGKNGGEQLLDQIFVIDQLHDPLLTIRSISVMWVTNDGEVHAAHTVPLFFGGADAGNEIK